jgi:hypothetical protein
LFVRNSCALNGLGSANDRGPHDSPALKQVADKPVSRTSDLTLVSLLDEAIVANAFIGGKEGQPGLRNFLSSSSG